MKTINFTKNILILIFFTGIFSSCQDEINEVNQYQGESIKNNFPLMKKILGVTSHHGSIDDGIDRESKFSINTGYRYYPFYPDISVFDSIRSAKDIEWHNYYLLENTTPTYNANNYDFEYPLRVTNYDYSEIDIQNVTELSSHKNNYSSLLAYSEIEEIKCIDFVYPISLSYYNNNFQIVSTLSSENEAEFYNLIEAMYYEITNDDHLADIGFDYPIQLKTFNDDIITVNSNEALLDEINNTTPNCERYNANYVKNHLSKQVLDSTSTPINSWKLSLNFNHYYDAKFLENDLLKLYDVATQDEFTGTWKVVAQEDAAYIHLDIATPNITLNDIEWRVKAAAETVFMEGATINNTGDKLMFQPQ